MESVVGLVVAVTLVALLWSCCRRVPSTGIGELEGTVVSSSWRAGVTLVFRWPFGIPIGRGRRFQPAVTFSARHWTFYSVELEAFSADECCCERTKSAIVSHFARDFSFLDTILNANFAPEPKKNNERAKGGCGAVGEVSVVIGNQPLPPFTDQVLKIANGSVICADGGANRLVDFYTNRRSVSSPATEENEDRAAKLWNHIDRLPNAVVGDLDSLRTDVRRTLECQGVPIIRDPDQDTNDLEKAWKHLCNAYQGKTTRALSAHDTVIVLGVLGGRFDHTIGNIHLLYKLSNLFFRSEIPQILLIDEFSACCICPKGHTRIVLPQRFVTECCGLLPLMPCRSVTTSGLKWDLLKSPLGMDGIVSSSNEVLSKDRAVLVETNDPLLWYSEVNQS